jgi:uncharacterized protein (TIGR02421 family)
MAFFCKMINSAVPVNKPAVVSLSSRHAQIRSLSDRLIEAQRSVRILEPIHWPYGVEEQFFARRCRELPAISRADYTRTPLPFDCRTKLDELYDLERDIRLQLGHANACSQMMVQRCRDYRLVVELLASRGTPKFSHVSQRLFGSTHWKPNGKGPSLRAIGRLVKQMANQLVDRHGDAGERRYDARSAVDILGQRLQRYFGDGVQFRVRLTHDLTADASAGGANINIRGDARFTDWELRLLEVHEGWVHLATTLNGRNQPWCAFLGKNSPSATVTQEGLAILTEILTGTSHPKRLIRLANRIEAVGMVEDGADFLDVYRFYLEQAETPRSSYQQAHRVFRGGLPAGCGPFTKDLGYSRGLILLLELIDRAERAGQVRETGLLFCGKTSVAELPNLAQLADEGILKEPEFIPPPFAAEAVLELWAGVARTMTGMWQSCFQGTVGLALEPNSARAGINTLLGTA